MTATFTRTCFVIYIFLFCITQHLVAQIDLSGRVEDAETNKPIANASVYFSNTTISTYTNDQGAFEFKQLRLINTNIIVYSPGYELLAFKPTTKNIEGRKIVFKLKLTEASKNKLQVNSEERKEAIKAFEEKLLGLTKEASECEVLNEDAIYFLAGETATSYKVMSDTPLIIVNKRLGYRINYNLVEFTTDFIHGEHMLDGFAMYTEMGNPKDFIDNRKRVYQGSSMHFFRSLVNHRLYQEQFETYWMKPVPSKSVLTSPPPNLLWTDKDTALLEPAKPMDILFIDSSNELSIRSPFKLLIYYAKNPYGKNYLINNGLVDGMVAKGVRSFLRFSAPSVGINYLGVLDDYSNVEYTGYWQYELLANKLPLDYDPGN